jgi:hypothetical protein
MLDLLILLCKEVAGAAEEAEVAAAREMETVTGAEMVTMEPGEEEQLW